MVGAMLLPKLLKLLPAFPPKEEIGKAKEEEEEEEEPEIAGRVIGVKVWDGRVSTGSVVVVVVEAKEGRED